uniref:Myb/SANT-like DNA-binding domain-containing protein n=1 Tax=Stomoxys calcitrans TaxID=35570 RepID=A0A1I8PMJ9_STOCA|nr:unnamed protein product [Stomoxys calcitrans]
MEKDSSAKQTRKRWSVEGEHFLLTLWVKHLEELREARKNAHVYINMAAAMSAKGYFYSREEIKTKLHNLTSKYRDEIKKSDQTGQPPSWDLFEKINKILGEYKYHKASSFEEQSFAITDTMSSRSYKSASAPPSHMATRTTDWSCGNVSFCFQAQRRVYVLNCMFCSQVCLHWDSFINHMEQEHDEDLCSEHLMQKEPPAVNIEHDYRIATKRRKTNTSNTSDNNRDGDDRLSNKADFNSDPLIATHDVTRFPENVSIKTESAMEIIDEYEDTNTISDKEDEASVTYEDEADITTDEQTANSYKAQTTATKSDVQALMDKLDLAHRLIYRLLDEVKSLKGQTSTTATNTPTVTSSRKNRQFERGDDFLQCDQKRSPDQRFMGFITEQQNL